MLTYRRHIIERGPSCEEASLKCLPVSYHLLLHSTVASIHEVTSPQAFKGLHLLGRKPWRAGSMLATLDHDVPMTAAEKFIGRGRHKRSGVENIGADMR